MDRNEFISHDTEDKGWWCHHGEILEKSFVDICRSQFGINVEINPEKQANRYAADLLLHENGINRLADLKVQNTPFFTCKRYGMNPQYTVTFNRKDYERYKKLYPDIIIFFWIDWQQTSWKHFSTNYLGGFFRADFREMASKIESGTIREHSYIYRVNDTMGNAKSSFMFDVRDFECIFKKEN